MTGFGQLPAVKKAGQAHAESFPGCDTGRLFPGPTEKCLNSYKKMGDEGTQAANEAPLAATGILDGYSIFSWLPDEI